MPPAYDAVIAGAGIAGVSAAYHLAVRRGIRRVLLADPRPPLSLTSAASTEAYRNWWPGPDGTLIALMNRSLDLLEALARETGNPFRLNRRGYLYVTGTAAGARALEAAARRAAGLGAGPLRIHRGRPDDPPYRPSPSEGFEGAPAGADLILDRGALRTLFPYLGEGAVAALHARRCGWLDAQGLGQFLLERARAAGVELRRAAVVGVDVAEGRVAGVRLAGPGGEERIATEVFVNAAGPFLADVARLLGVDLPVYCELHAKVILPDPEGAVPRDAPLLIWNDPQRLPWSDEERRLLAADPEGRALLEELPGGAHLRPEGGSESPYLLLLWDYRTERSAPRFPPTFDPYLYDVVLRGTLRLVPGLARYLERPPRPQIDGGYYTRTAENLPLIGPLPVKGAYVLGALSGYGIMASQGAADLLAAWIAGEPLPAYAELLAPTRYDDPTLRVRAAAWDGRWQL